MGVITVLSFFILGLFSFFSKTSSPVLKLSSSVLLSSVLAVELLSTTTLVASPLAGPSTVPVPSLYIPKLSSSPSLPPSVGNGGFGVIILNKNKKSKINPTINKVNKAAVALSFLLSCCAAIILFSVSWFGC